MDLTSSNFYSKMEDGDDDTFLHELFSLLDDTPDTLTTLDTTLDNALIVPPLPASAPSKRPAGTGGAAGMKRTVDAARAEFELLHEQLTRLRAGHHPDLMVAKEHALQERRKRQRAEAECCALREAVYTQHKFIHGLRSVFSGIPRFALGYDLCRYLHRHTLLTRNRHARWGTFDLDAHNARMRSAMDVLCHETQAMSLSGSDDLVRLPDPSPLIDGEAIDTGDGYTTNSMAVYAVNSADLSAVVRAACVAVRDVVAYCASGHPLIVSRDIVDVDASPASNVLYRVMAVRHPCASRNEELSIETHILTSYKIMDDYAIVMWDFVDVDELHPTSDTTDIGREVTGACLIRREWCRDGVERTIFRSLMTKKFRFLNQESACKIRRFSCITDPAAMVHGNEMLFRRIVLDQLATENAIYSQTQPYTHQ